MSKTNKRQSYMDVLKEKMAISKPERYKVKEQVFTLASLPINLNNLIEQVVTLLSLFATKSRPIFLH